MAEKAKKISELAPFITLEGGEGVGKTTQQRMLIRRIKGMGVKVEATKEPGATRMGAEIRRLLSEAKGEGLTPRAELLLFLADRAQHVDRVIRPALEGGLVVVSDRFTDSSEVYQGRARGLGWEDVRRLNQVVCKDVWPDLTIVLDLDPSLGIKRVNERQGSLGLVPDRMENEGLDFHQAVRQGFLDQAQSEPERIKVVNANQAPEDLADQVWDLTAPLIKEFKARAS
jgi:dTMP kinase